MDPADREIRCDGCGVLATSEHLSQRIARLEFATRFRPIRIDTLLLDLAPPSRLEDYFYRPAVSQDERSPKFRVFFDVLVGAAGGNPSRNLSEDILLAEFQRAGCFLVECCECPLQDSGISLAANLAAHFAQSILRRVQYSYRPKHIVLLSHELSPLIPVFQASELGDKLLLCDGKPIEGSRFEDSAAIVRFQTDLEAILAKTLMPSAGD